MRRFLSAVLAAFFLCSATALAGTRIVVFPGQNPSSTQTNQEVRFERLSKGTWFLNALGSGTAAGGVYSNLSVVPNGGMYVAVQPTQANTLGSLYQLTSDDLTPIPASMSPNLPADSTQIVVQGLQSGPTSSIGPITAPVSGQSQYYLLEAQIQQQDGGNQSILFVNSSGTSSYQNVNTTRTDVIVYQLKAGTASSSPVAPSVDSGWIGLAQILVPGGASSITSGMISALPAFNGFVQQGANVTLGGLTVSSLGAGCLQSSSSGVVSSLPCTSGLGSVVGSNPIVATTASSTATVSCPTCVTSVSGTGNIASTGGTTPSLSLTGTIPFSNLPTTIAQTGVNNNFSVTQNFQGIAATSLSLSTTPLAISSGGTGSATQNFVDLTSAQTVGGVKTFSSAPVSANGFTAGSSSYGPTSATINGGIGTQGAAAASGIDWSCGGSAANCKVYGPKAFTYNSTTCPSYIALYENNGTADAYIDCTGSGYFNGSLNAASASIGGTAAVGTINMSASGNGITTPAVNYINTNNKLTITADGGGQNYIESGNNGFTGNVPLNITGYFGNQGSTLNLNFATIGLYGSPLAYNGNAFRVTPGTVANANGDTVLGIVSANNNYIGCTGVTENCTLYFYTNGTGSAYTAKIDGSGNITATNFFTGSRREWKKDITPYKFDALDLLDHVDFKEYVCKDPRCGAVGSHHIGIIANDSPSQIAGKKHDHYDAFALAAIDGKAITELRKQVTGKSDPALTELTAQVRVLEGIVAVLLVWCGLLTFGGFRRA